MHVKTVLVQQTHMALPDLRLGSVIERIIFEGFAVDSMATLVGESAVVASKDVKFAIVNCTGVAPALSRMVWLLLLNNPL